MYKILNDLSALQLSNSFVKLNDTNINYNLRNIETDLALPRPYTNFLKRSFKYSDAMLWAEQFFKFLWGKDRTIVVGFSQTQTCLFAFHAFYWIALISYFKCIYIWTRRWPLKFSLEHGRNHCGRSKWRGLAVKGCFSKQTRDSSNSGWVTRSCVSKAQSWGGVLIWDWL